MLFSFFLKKLFSGLSGGMGKRTKNDPKQQQQFVSLHISGTVHHMIVVFGTHV